MSIAKWDESYRTGHRLVDKQHEKLFGIVNNLHDSIVAGTGKEILEPTLRELAKYTIDHFRDEEALMVSINYPMLPPHKAKHEALTRQVTELMGKFQEGKLVLSITLSSFLADWLRHHIKEDDKALIAYLKAHPIAEPVAADR